MLIIPGGQAFSSFRIRKKLQEVQKQVARIKKLEACFVYFVGLITPLSESKQKILEELLAYTPLLSKLPAAASFLVIPRLGTVSPWSSKATDIAHNVGLKEVHRIERGIAYLVQIEGSPLEPFEWQNIATLLHDRMTETVIKNYDEAEHLFTEQNPSPLHIIDILAKGRSELMKANKALGLALDENEIDYFLHHFLSMHRNPTDAELMMFAQLNSEHCRHKIFRGNWEIDGIPQKETLFEMIQNTHHQNPDGILSAYHDNAAVVEGTLGQRFFSDTTDRTYRAHPEPIHIVMKVETHNHPTAVSPFPGSATGAGGEIRDGAALGIGAKPKAGFSGFAVSHLLIPNFHQPWEIDFGKPNHLSSSLEIMLEGPIGAASFNNEFGRPQIAGFFRTFSGHANHEIRGYHKPIMLAGGIGNVRPSHVFKQSIPEGAKLIALGGPTFAIGMGGASASSLSAGANIAELDFASVQRSNPEMQRRCQEVIDGCSSLGQDNPILSIHDIGAGGFANAIPELVHAVEKGGTIELRNFFNGDPKLSPMEIWCNESQERYMLAIHPEKLEEFVSIAERERCPYRIVGEVMEEEQLIVTDALFKNKVIEMPLSVLLDKPPKLLKKVSRIPSPLPPLPEGEGKCGGSPLQEGEVDLKEIIARVLRFPSVADKTFLITIADRTVGGLIARDQMVGPWQVPVSDVGVTLTDFNGETGEAVSVGERTPLSLLNPGAAARMAVAESLTNIAAANISSLSQIRLSANWMVASGNDPDDVALFDMVKTVGLEFCPALGLAIPVGKDSMSMSTKWEENGVSKSVKAPPSLIVSAFAPVLDVRKTLTPELVPTAIGFSARRREVERAECTYKYMSTRDERQQSRKFKCEGYKTEEGPTDLILIDLGEGKNRLGASVLAQVYQELGDTAPDIQPDLLKSFFHCIQTLNQQNKILAYHDRSDGGLFITLLEMAFAGNVGIDAHLEGTNPIGALFNEECGAVLQIKHENLQIVLDILKENGLAHCSHLVGTLNPDREFRIWWNNALYYVEHLTTLHRIWSETTFRLQSLRDNPDSAQEEYDNLLSDSPGLSVHLTYPLPEAPLLTKIPPHPPLKRGESFNTSPLKRGESFNTPPLKKGGERNPPPLTKGGWGDLAFSFGKKPKIAILREQGVNGQIEMAAAFDRAGFECVDVHMTDLLQKKNMLSAFKGIVSCGGFSYGDVLGAGRGWAQTILHNPILLEEFTDFFQRPDTFALGVCNGCQLFSHLKTLIPGANNWPQFAKNVSEQFEARVCLVTIEDSPSILLRGMAGSRLPIATAHGEGKAEFNNPQDLLTCQEQKLIALRYVDPFGKITERYPYNPNGSPQGITGLTTPDGRVTILMPHPERVFRTVQNSWHPKDWKENSPWMQLFLNAKKWVDEG